MSQQRANFVITNPAESLEQELPDVDPVSPDKSRVIFKSVLELTRLQEDALVDRAFLRYQHLDSELGRSEALNDVNGATAMDTNRQSQQNRKGKPALKFMEKRTRYSLMAQNDYSWRREADPTAIYAKSNLVVPLRRRICGQQTARAGNYFFGSTPWVSVTGIGAADEQLGRSLQKLVDNKLLENQNQDRLQRSIEIGFQLGEAVNKVTMTRDSSFYRTIVNCLVDEAGNPVVGQDGQPILPTDQWVPYQAPEGEMASEGVSLNGPLVLLRDRVTVKPDFERYADVTLDRENVFFQGPEIKTVYFKDFLCPLTAETVQAKHADCICHVQHYSASALAMDYMENPATTLDELQAAVQGLRTVMGASGEGKIASTSRQELQDDGQPILAESGIMEIGEFWIRFDADGDGIEEDIMLVMDLRTKTPIYYNYAGNMTESGLRPFYPLVPKPVPGRWYGQGTYEIFESYQDTIDLFVNRRNVSQGAAGRVTLFRPQNTKEGESNPNLKMNGGNTYTPREGKTAKDILEVVYLDDNKYEHLTEEIQFFMQLALNESGVQHANDANMAGMETTKLATGIRNIEKSGQEAFGQYISEIEGGIRAAAEAFVECLFANIEDEEIFTVLENDVPQELTVAARDVKHLKFNIQVLLTRYKDEQIVQSCDQATMVIDKFYALPPPLQALQAPLYVKILSSFQIPNAGNYIKPQQFSVPIAGPGGAPQVQPGQSNVPPPNL